MAALAPDDPRHGTRNGYDNLRCRCDRCRAVWRDYVRQRSHRLGYRVPMSVYLAEQAARAEAAPHGTENKYVNHGCRCDECRQAATEARLKRLPRDPEQRRAIWREAKRRERARKRVAA